MHNMKLGITYKFMRGAFRFNHSEAILVHPILSALGLKWQTSVPYNI